MWIINAFLTWMLWRTHDDMMAIDRPFLAWVCLIFSAANGAIVATYFF